MNLKGTLNRILGALFIAAFIGINLVTLKDGHNWGGDFSQYILNALNIIHHRDYSEGIMFDNDAVYPPGFPLLLVPLIKVFGVDFLAFKVINIIFWYLGILFLYPVLVRRLDKTVSGFFCLFWAGSSFFFTFKQNVLSDIPFFFFTAVSVYVFIKFCEVRTGKFSRQQMFFLSLFIVLASCAIWIRSAGLTLWVAAIAYLFVVEKDKRAAGVLAILFLINMGGITLITGVHPGYLSWFFQNPLDAVVRIFRHSALIFLALSWAVLPGQIVLTSLIYRGIAHVLMVISPLLILYIPGRLLFQMKKRQAFFEDYFLFFYFLLLLTWTFFYNPPDGFSRYVLPVSAYLFIFFIKNIFVPLGRLPWQKFFTPGRSRLGTLIIGFVLACNMLNIRHNMDFNDDVLYQSENQELFRWVRENLAREDRYMFYKPTVMALMTGRVGTAAMTHPNQRETWMTRIPEYNIKYLIFDVSMDQQTIDMLKGHPWLHEVWRNARYCVLKVVPPPPV